MNKILRAAVCLAALMGVAQFASAGDAGFDEGEWYFSPMGTYVFKEDDARFSNNGGGLHLGFGRAFGDNWAIELNGVGNVLSGDSVHDIAQWGIGLDVVRMFDVWDSWTPYAVAGTGFLKSETNENGNSPRIGPDNENAFGSLGLGIAHQFGDSDALFRTEVRYRADFADPDTYSDFLFNIGFLMPFGGEPKAPPVFDADGDGVVDGSDLCPGTPVGIAVDSTGCERDSDRDGVKDSKDKCPSTPRGSDVDADGCRIVGDADGDGVNDDDDRCPNTPSGANVDQYGCVEIGDEDNDGVPDNIDECPGSAQGVRIDARGCEIKDEIRLPGVEFELSSAVLTAASNSVLDGAAATMAKYPEITVQAEGHTDSSGPTAYNQRLSQERADAVRLYLISRGVDASRITARGYGESSPIADNNTPEGMQRNRRVTLRLTSGQ